MQSTQYLCKYICTMSKAFAQTYAQLCRRSLLCRRHERRCIKETAEDRGPRRRCPQLCTVLLGTKGCSVCARQSFPAPWSTWASITARGSPLHELSPFDCFCLRHGVRDDGEPAMKRKCPCVLLLLFSYYPSLHSS